MNTRNTRSTAVTYIAPRSAGRRRARLRQLLGMVCVGVGCGWLWLSLYTVLGDGFPFVWLSALLGDGAQPTAGVTLLALSLTVYGMLVAYGIRRAR